jgi:hypothetical protein
MKTCLSHGCPASQANQEDGRQSHYVTIDKPLQRVFGSLMNSAVERLLRRSYKRQIIPRIDPGDERRHCFQEHVPGFQHWPRGGVKKDIHSRSTTDIQ